MEKDTRFYLDTIRRHQPFNALQIKAIKEVDGDCLWVKDEEADYFGVYGRSEDDNLFYCIADCKTKGQAEDLESVLSTISRFTLTHVS